MPPRSRAHPAARSLPGPSPARPRCLFPAVATASAMPLPSPTSPRLRAGARARLVAVDEVGVSERVGVAGPLIGHPPQPGAQPAEGAVQDGVGLPGEVL